MNELDLNFLASLFSRFPGIGPRQAKRLVYFLLQDSSGLSQSLGTKLLELKNSVRTCPDCCRYFTTFDKHASAICKNCQEKSESRQLLIVEKDVDLENVLRLGVYNGLYFILGAVIPMGQNINSLGRLPQLKERVTVLNKNNDLEVILGFSANVEGDITEKAIHNYLLENFPNLKISALGKGLSSGTELEYSDSDTLREALKNRH